MVTIPEGADHVTSVCVTVSAHDMRVRRWAAGHLIIPGIPRGTFAVACRGVPMKILAKRMVCPAGRARMLSAADALPMATNRIPQVRRLAFREKVLGTTFLFGDARPVRASPFFRKRAALSFFDTRVVLASPLAGRAPTFTCFGVDFPAATARRYAPALAADRILKGTR